MLKYLIIVISILCISVISAGVCWLNTEHYVQQNTCSLSDLVNDPDAVEAAIQKMGPYKNYLITVDGRVLVRVNNQWLRLHYNKEGL